MTTLFPLWDHTGTYILLDAENKEILLTETEARVAIGRQEVGLIRPPGKSRAHMKLYLKVPQAHVAGKSPLTKRLQLPQPNCIGTEYGYMHVAHRCHGFYDGRPVADPRIDASCL